MLVQLAWLCLACGGRSDGNYGCSTCIREKIILKMRTWNCKAKYFDIFVFVVGMTEYSSTATRPSA